MVRVNVELDLPPGAELLGYERSGDGHGFEVEFPLREIANGLKAVFLAFCTENRKSQDF